MLSKWESIWTSQGLLDRVLHVYDCICISLYTSCIIMLYDINRSSHNTHPILVIRFYRSSVDRLPLISHPVILIPGKKKSGKALDRLMKMSVMPWSKSTKPPTPVTQRPTQRPGWNITWGHGGFIFHMDFRACVVLRSSISWCHDLSFFKIWTRITYKQYKTIYNWL